MKKPYVVLADMDANYLVPLEDKLTEELYDQIELEIITDREYFDFFFATPKKIDTLIISDDLFSQELLRHNVTNYFVLTEHMGESHETDEVTHIFKYSSTKEILNQILYKNRDMLNVQLSHRETQVIVVTSGVGGSGTTTLSLALSDSLVRNHKRVLYISTDIMQGFSYYLQNKSPLPNDIVRLFGSNDEKLYSGIMPYLRHEGFTYLPPFSRSIQSIGLDNSIYNRLINAAKSAKDYDYIVIDTDIDLDESKAELVRDADRVIINVLQDEYSTYKTEYLIRNMDCRNNEKFLFVCNKFRRDMVNDYMASPIGQQFIITEYIDELPAHKAVLLGNFTDLAGIRDLGYIFS